MGRGGIPAIIDVDPGIDDAAALFIALTCSRLDTRLVTTVGGSVDVRQATENTLRLQAFLGSRVFVVQGADLPGSAKRRVLREALGPSGLGSWVFAGQATDLLAAMPVGEAIWQACVRNEDPARGVKATMVCLGPLTNLALALAAHPDLPEHLGRVICMGGALSMENVPQVAGRNITADPAAARAVLAAGVRPTFVPLEVAGMVPMSESDMVDIALSGRVGNAVYTMLSGAHTVDGRGKEIADPVALCLATHPELFRVEPCRMVVRDVEPSTCELGDPRPNARVATSVDVDGFRSWFKWALERASR